MTGSFCHQAFSYVLRVLDIMFFFFSFFFFLACAVQNLLVGSFNHPS